MTMRTVIGQIVTVLLAIRRGRFFRWCRTGVLQKGQGGRDSIESKGRHGEEKASKAEPKARHHNTSNKAITALEGDGCWDFILGRQCLVVHCADGSVSPCYSVLLLLPLASVAVILRSNPPNPSLLKNVARAGCICRQRGRTERR